jgi:LmbE family N-acetylglucosaminyl deacetylase
MNILAVGPHPDDVEFGCGGTLLQFARRGAKIHLLCMSDGAEGGDPGTRAREAERAASVLRAKLHWGGFRDTRVEVSKESVGRIETALRESKADLVFIPFGDDTHQDHRRTSRAARAATRRVGEVLFYETPSSVDFRPTVFVDVGAVLSRKLRLLKAHRSQSFAGKVFRRPLSEAARTFAAFRGLQGGMKAAEGFMPVRLTLDPRVRRAG